MTYFRAHAEEAADRQHRERISFGVTIRSSIFPTVSLASLTTELPTYLEGPVVVGHRRRIDLPSGTASAVHPEKELAAPVPLRGRQHQLKE